LDQAGVRPRAVRDRKRGQGGEAALGRHLKYAAAAICAPALGYPIKVPILSLHERAYRPRAIGGCERNQVSERDPTSRRRC
jgi:hypothetical protein